MTEENRRKMAQLFKEGKAPEFEIYAEEFADEKPKAPAKKGGKK